MAEVDYGEAVQALKNAIGTRYDSIQNDGRNDMVAALKRELGYSNSQANDAIDAMIQNGTLRYHTGEASNTDDAEIDATDPDTDTPNMVGSLGIPASGGVAPGLGASTPLFASTYNLNGYWQIGSDSDGSTDIGSAAGRAGQVDPTA